MDVRKIFGPPGTGKTTTCIGIVEKELTRLDPNEIAYVSFTREGAYTARSRAIERFAYGVDDLPYFRTLHSMAFREAGFTYGALLQPKDYKKFSKALGMNFHGFYTEELQHNDDRYLQHDFLRRSNPAQAEKMLPSLNVNKLAYVTQEYARFKEYFGLSDYTDLLTQYLKIGEPLPVKAAIIDEAQDLTPLQWAVAHKAFSNAERLYIAGDDDQAIYEWNGADVRAFLHHPGTVQVLDTSYRLPDAILDYSKCISAEIRERQEKDYHGTGAPGTVQHIADLQELDVSTGSWMMLARNNRFLSRYEEALAASGMIWSRAGKLSYDQAHVKAINAWTRGQKKGGLDEKAALAVKPFIGRHLPPISVPWYEALNFPGHKTEYYRNVLARGTDLSDRRIRVDTIHKVKGGEADNVVLMLDISRPVADNYISSPDSENRVYYVGATRARRNLYLLHPSGKYGYRVYR